ncbi:WAP-type 'four-disulfide core [Trichinella nativa]|uniref:WAP-type 'four-disulfide core n=1 Tax=Trichinella nativa TaxID=6335 RepID=A0A1Y3ENY8_9BILA|nr:WAP-type 'four-disulfide core [Trichinella nativa]
MNMKVSICLLLFLATAVKWLKIVLAIIEAVRKEEKPGECPRILRNLKAVGKRCRKDKDCANADKCCFAGLKKVCTTALFPATTPQPKLTTTKQAYTTKQSGTKYQSNYIKGKLLYVYGNAIENKVYLLQEENALTCAIIQKDPEEICVDVIQNAEEEKNAVWVPTVWNA